MPESVEALETIDLLYQAALDPTLWREALHRFALATWGVGTALIPITPGNITGLIVSPELDESNIEYNREWWKHDSRVLRIHTRKLKGGICCEAELFTDDELARDPLRQEFLRSYGIGAFAAQLVAPLPNLVVAFSVQRALERGEFERRELKTLSLLGRHAARALLVGARLAAARQLEQTIIDALAQFDCGALVVDRDLTILYANPAALQLVGDGLSITQGHLGVSSREHKRVFVRLMRTVVRRSPATGDLDTIALRRPSGRRPLLLQAIPISTPTGEWASRAAPRRW
jgi:PAS domain-containing protein